MNTSRRIWTKAVRRAATAGMTAVLLAGFVQPVGNAEPFPMPAPRPGAPTPQSYPDIPVEAAEAQPLPPTTTGDAVEPAVRAAAETVTVTLPASDGDAVTSADFVDAGVSGIEVASAADEPTGEIPVTVQVLDSAQSAAIGATGLALRVTSPEPVDVSLKIPDQVVSDAIGANYVSRVTWTTVPSEEPAAEAQPVETQDATTSDETGQRSATQMQTESSPSGTTVMAASAPTASDGSGSFGATPLSASSSWQMSGNTGSFTWSYPITAPPAPAGPAPQVSLDYDSGSVDGRTGNSNNQASILGEGWNLSGGGFIERSYAACSQDGQSNTGDLCWFSDNATISFGGHSGTLVKDSSGVWRLQNDDGTKIERLTGATNGDNNGEYWKVTTTDGVQYFFGRNRLPSWQSGNPETGSTWTVPVFGNQSGEPCNSSTFAASFCTQAWRWNLDHVVDPHGNAEVFYYDKQQNAYLRNTATKTTYDMGGFPNRIEYALRAGSEYTTAPARVLFDKADRCESTTNCTASNTANWPDVPWDLYCLGTSCTGNVSPSFFTTWKLGAIRTQIDKGGFVDVDKWAFTHTFPTTGDGTSRTLWLSAIARTGYAGSASATVPNVTFGGTAMQNRVWAYDGLAPLVKYRINAITLETGASIAVTYSATECSPSNLPAAPESNTKRCYPQRWVPPAPAAQTERLDYFHRYLVTAVSVNPGPSSGSFIETTNYDYIGSPAWRYTKEPLIPVAKRTWSLYAGYAQVKTRHGDPSAPATQETSVTTYFRGLNGDRLNTTGGTKSVSVAASDTTSVADDLWLAGRTRETTTYVGDGGARVANTIDTPWLSPTIATDGTNEVRRTGITEQTTRTALAAGGNQTVTTKTTNDSLGRPTAIDELGDTATGDDDRCTRITYVDNTTLNLLNAPSRTTVVGVACTGTPSLPADAISDTRLFYDGSTTFGQQPTRGLVTRTDVAASYSGSTPTYQTTSTGTFDALGRSLTTVDPRLSTARTTSTSYTPSTGLTTQTVETNPLGWTTTTTMDPARGSVLSLQDANLNLTEATYDPMGRRTQVWLPNRPKTTYPTEPSSSYQYAINNTAPSWTASTTLTAAGGYVTSYQIFDGLLRPRQIQTPQYSADGRVVSDITYDMAGRRRATNDPYTASGTPGGTVVTPTLTVPSGTVTQYDGAGRVTADIKIGNDVEMWRTSYTYGGNVISVTPPAGGTPTSTFTNAQGQPTEIKQYLATTPTGTAHSTTYTYDNADRLTAMTDAQGNKWTWTFDVLGRPSTTLDPDSGTNTTTYDAAGRVATKTDARNQVLAYTYDALDRPTGRFITSTTGTRLSSWTYDTATGGKGKIAAATRYVGSDQYINRTTAYDTLGNPTNQEVVVPTSAGGVAGTYAFTMTYTANGSLATRRLPAMGGLALEGLRYGYDNLGRPVALTSSQGSYVSGAYYTELGELAQTMQFGGSLELYNTWTRLATTQRVIKATTMSVNNGAGNQTAKHDYTYNAAGLLTADRDTPDGQTADQQCYRYDTKQQLTDAWTPNATDCSAAPGAAGYAGPAPYRVSYSYSATGNRTQETNWATSGTNHQVRTYSYNTAGSTSVRPHATTSITTTGPGAGTSSFGYDAAGHTTNQAGRTLTYNTEGQLATAVNGTANENRIYSADGDLMLITGTSGTQLFLGETILSTPSGSTTVSGSRTYTLGGIPFAERTTTNGTANTLTYLVANAQGTVQQHFSLAGAVTRFYSKPFGITRAPTTSWPGARGYLNQPTNTITGLTHLGARDYDPTNGRFTTVDPILTPTNPAQNNGYNYSANDPINKSDPNGLCYQNSATGQYEGINCGGSSLPDINAPTATHKVTEWVRGSDNKQVGTRYFKDFTKPYLEQVKIYAPGESPAEKGLQFALDVSGVQGVIDCVSNPSLSGCASAAAGFLPVGRAVKALEATADAARFLATSTKITSTTSTALVKVPDFASTSSAFEHYAKHSQGVVLGKNGKASVSPYGVDMPEFNDFDSYRKAARSFMSGAGDGTMQGYRTNGDLVRFDPSSGYFGISSPDGVLRTFFRPAEGQAYFLKEFN